MIIEWLRRAVKWTMLWVFALGSVRRYFALRGAVTLVASRMSLYERRHIQFLGTALNSGDTAIDVGANFGAYTQEMARLVGRDGRVLSFEPITEVFDVLNRRMRRFASVSCRCQALSDVDKQGVELRIPVLWGSFPEPALATVEPITTPHEVRTIDLIRLDDLAGEITSCAFIKVDVEGHESAFLRGALGVIERHRPLIQIESNDIARDAAEYRAYAEKIDYDLRYLDAEARLQSLGDATSVDEYNFYLVPHEWRPREPV
jgi:FkbM family methyltransferase